MGAALEINTGGIAPEYLKGHRIMLGSDELGVFDGSTDTMHFDISSGRHVVYLKDGLATSGAVAFRVQPGHCARITMEDSDAGMFAPMFGGWFALHRAGDTALPAETPGAQEIGEDEVPSQD